ncbi:uncharacterized protein [Pempheris klunzingeri]|uniref:uncharacterized protein n=1 Tax=Pempheris klunzingeri TaxID=3127111 RepID=UPI00397F1230
MMVGFRRIKLSLFLMLLPQFTAVIGQFPPHFVVRDGGEVTLSCQNAINDQDGCNMIDWIFIAQNKVVTELVESGQIIQQARAKSDRLSVTETCSLVIKKVTAEDVGFYICREKKPELQSSVAHLSLITLTEQTDGDMVTLNCSVSTYGGCEHTVKWLYEDKNIDTETSQSDCSVTLTFPATRLKQKPKDRELFKCEVNGTYNRQTQQFTYSPLSSGEEASTTRSPPAAAQEARAGCSVLDYMMLVIRVAEILLITVITVLLFRARGKQRAADDKTVHHGGDGHDGTVNYENMGEPSASVRLH